MKRFFISFTGILSIMLFFTGCYYVTYRSTVKKFENNKTRQDILLTGSVSEPKMGNAVESDDGTQPDTEVSAEDAIITSDTVCRYELYYIDTGEQVQYEANPTAEFAGLTRKQLTNKLNQYMENLSVMEYEAGLISYEVISFSPERVVLQKVYDREKVRYRYFVTIKNEEVVVYYSDKKTVFEYTGIIQNSLDETVRSALRIGIPVKDVEELYDFLSGITS